MSKWHDLGPAENFKKQPLSEVEVNTLKFAISWLNGQFGAVSGVCNHAGGPLGCGVLNGEYIVCPWHHWTFHCRTGKGEPGYEADAVPSHNVKVENGHLWMDLEAATKRSHLPHPVSPLSRPVERRPGPVRVAGISTTVMDRKFPRYSTSEALLQIGLDHAQGKLGCESKMIKLNDLKFRNCEGYYSKGAGACTWPCSITQMDKTDELTEVYEALVFWADVVIVATPIRWGAASSLYFKMAERLNCVQNQVTINDNVLIRNKVAGFIITGGQDNIQAVAGMQLGFFAEIGFQFPQFPYIAHSRGWSAEDMEHNIDYVQHSEELREASRELVGRSVELAKCLLKVDAAPDRIPRGGRKAHHLEMSPDAG